MPRKIGRYEILGELAQGGMAELHLARLVGPSGFERPVVIKRIRDDLDKSELTDLFLEEARLAAKIRHANVVHVEDLGTDGGHPYIVMEYLEGESVSNLTRRLLARGESLPLGLAAYIVAEACAGLHAAHELRDADGALLGLVHRDVSPQNLFLTYAGAVKVVDFGVAKTGEPTEDVVRGKVSYMAPEQLMLKPVDRRTDVFALGVILYELVTGRRLFKKFSHEATTRALLTDPILPPRRIAPSVTEALDRVCMRALARDPGERYATAADMRRELLVANRELLNRELLSEEPSAELAALMARCFADRIEDKRVLLRTVREGSVVSHVPAGDVDVTIEIPVIEEDETARAWETAPLGPPISTREPVLTSTVVLARPGVSTQTTFSAVEPEPSDASPPPRRSRIVRALAIGAVLSIAVVVTASVARRTSGGEASRTSGRAAATEEAKSEAAAAPATSTPPAESPADSASTASIAVRGATRPAPSVSAMATTTTTITSAATTNARPHKKSAPAAPAPAPTVEPAEPVGSATSTPSYRRFK